MITIHRPVQVKVIITEASRKLLLSEYRQKEKQLLHEWDQWRFQSRKLLSEAQKKSGEAYKLALDRVDREERTRKEKVEMLQFQIKQVENLPEGCEIHYTTVESSVQVDVGDVWDEIMGATEIILKDGVIAEIRQGGQSE
ncbi:YlqD family protein [Brevibacillus humidisoli]|uniref:YlqD family protein n=1 Tax=Brevibacillus humidisoli TaxID=2895522 RepID=UPI001E36C57C|nr:YlqD family protein [Brevibacillus humidisoli]UFJ42086.1 YlqD family protein [Brevibacillus humidisoli]